MWSNPESGCRRVTSPAVLLTAKRRNTEPPVQLAHRRTRQTSFAAESSPDYDTTPSFAGSYQAIKSGVADDASGVHEVRERKPAAIVLGKPLRSRL